MEQKANQQSNNSTAFNTEAYLLELQTLLSEHFYDFKSAALSIEERKQEAMVCVSISKLLMLESNVYKNVNKNPKFDVKYVFDFAVKTYLEIIDCFEDACVKTKTFNKYTYS